MCRNFNCRRFELKCDHDRIMDDNNMLKLYLSIPFKNINYICKFVGEKYLIIVCQFRNHYHFEKIKHLGILTLI